MAPLRMRTVILALLVVLSGGYLVYLVRVNSPPRAVSELIIYDLNGDGFAYTPLANSKTYFDIDADKLAERTEWISGADGFLARDTNGNGKIDGQQELFGDNGGTRAYAKLAALDANGDKKITAADAGFSTLRIWRDANSNGKTDAGELKTLAQWGITSLSLDDTMHPSGDKPSRASSAVANSWLEVDKLDSWYVGNGSPASVHIDLETVWLPLSRGYGNLPSLHFAMSQDPALKSMMKEFVALNPTTQMHMVYDKAEALLLRWGNVQSVAPGEDGNGTKRALLAKISGLDLRYVQNVDEGMEQFLGVMLQRLLVQGSLEKVFVNATYDFAKDDIMLRQPIADILVKAKQFAPTAVPDKMIYWNEILRILLGHKNELALSASQIHAYIDTAAGYKTADVSRNLIRYPVQ